MRRKCRILAVLVMGLGIAALNLPKLPRALSKIGGDFNMRYNEVLCVRDGINPYDIWTGKVESDKYYAAHRSNPRHSPLRVHAYAPWEYTFLFPLSFLPKRCASLLFHALCLGTLAFLAAVAYRRGYTTDGQAVSGMFCALACFLVGPGINACFDTQNYAIVSAGAIFLMALSLDRGNDIVAGVAWAVLMIKPLNGALFAIPLLFLKKWRTVATAVGICCLSTLLPALLTRTSPVDLVECISHTCTEFVHATIFFPVPLFSINSLSTTPGKCGA